MAACACCSAASRTAKPAAEKDGGNTVAQRYEGKAKVVETLPGSDDLVRITFKDDATAGDGAKKDRFAGKGACCAEITCLVFEYLGQRGIETHFVERAGENAFIGRHVEIIPLEVVVRNVTAGSLCRRLGIDSGKPIRPPIVEFYLKNDELHDPLMTEDYIRLMNLAQPDELNVMRREALRVNDELGGLFNRAGLLLVDFKLEYGRFGKGLILADEITPETCRLWEGQRSLDKDVFRRGEGSPLPGYHEVLQRLRPLIAEEPVA
jgi:phosphoribosylaminoimidazole-succinocarboxamide synthase